MTIRPRKLKRLHLTIIFFLNNPLPPLIYILVGGFASSLVLPGTEGNSNTQLVVKPDQNTTCRLVFSVLNAILQVNAFLLLLQFYQLY